MLAGDSFVELSYEIDLGNLYNSIFEFRLAEDRINKTTFKISSLWDTASCSDKTLLNYFVAKAKLVRSEARRELGRLEAAKHDAFDSYFRAKQDHNPINMSRALHSYALILHTEGNDKKSLYEYDNASQIIENIFPQTYEALIVANEINRDKAIALSTTREGVGKAKSLITNVGYRASTLDQSEETIGIIIGKSIEFETRSGFKASRLDIIYNHFNTAVEYIDRTRHPLWWSNLMGIGFRLCYQAGEFDEALRFLNAGIETCEQYELPMLAEKLRKSLE